MLAQTHTILIVEDADSLRQVLHSVLQHEGFNVLSFGTADEALKALKEQPNIDCILSDFKLPLKNGVDFLREVREFNRVVPFILMTAFGSIEIAVEAMKYGANDFISKPFEPTRLCGLVSEVIEHRRIIDRSLGLRTRRQRAFITKNHKVDGMLRDARKVARVDTSVLLLGESGTGKELIARYVHEHSPRADKPFIAVNCGAMPEALLESEFFGHEAGAFTGATQTRIGVFELAHEGSLFLDEIGDMPRLLQVKLLRALQEREIKRVGGSKLVKANPRIIAATNVNLEDALASGQLREDLYFRLAVVSLSIPALRERPEDIATLADYYKEYFCNQTGKQLECDERTRTAMLRYSWPGNARELENVVERAVILAEGSIQPEHLGLQLNFDFDTLSAAQASLHDIAEKAMREAEVIAIRKVLIQTKGNKSRAAEVLGVSYKTLLTKVKDYDLENRKPVT